jgi:hypothetical protein
MSKNTALMITNKESDLSGIIHPIDENNLNIVWEDGAELKMNTTEFDELMESEEYDLSEVEIKEDTPAQDSIKAHSRADVPPGAEADGNPKTRLDMIRAILGNLADLDTVSLTKFLDDQQAMIGGEGTRAGVDGMAAQNAASVSMKPSAAMESVIPKLQKSEQDAIFSESTLTEEAKTKMTTLFESAVLTRVAEELVKIQDDYNEKLDSNITEITSNLIEQMDTFLNHVGEEWLKENQVAIESSLRNELTSEFIDRLQEVFTEAYIDIPEEKVKVVEKLVKENEELTEKLNSVLNENIERDKKVKMITKENILNNVSEGLTIVEKEKLKKLAETVDFESDKAFTTKIATLKEGFVQQKPSTSNIVTESIHPEKSPEPSNSSDYTISRMAEVLKNAKI